TVAAMLWKSAVERKQGDGFLASRPLLTSSRRSLLEKTLMPQPVGTRPRPGGAGVFARADTEIMGGAGIDVQLRRNAGALERPIKNHAVFGAADNIAAAVGQKDGRRPGRD